MNDSKIVPGDKEGQVKTSSLSEGSISVENASCVPESNPHPAPSNGNNLDGGHQMSRE